MLDQEHDQASLKGAGSKAPGAGTLVILCIVFLPAMIVGGLVYLLLRKGHQRFSVIFLTVLLLESILAIAWFATSALEKVMSVVGDLSAIGETWTQLLPAVLIGNFAFGGLIGLFFSGWDIRQMRVNPHRLLVSGSWMYKFEYKRTPWQALRRKKTIERLKTGGFAAPDRAPLGLDEGNGDVVAYRYNSEAAKQTLINGAAGSGKTITLLSLILNDIQNGSPVIVIDFKRSPELASKIAAWTKENDGNFYHFVNGTPKSYDVKNSPGQAFYDPLRNGSATAKADMVLGMREYDTASAVYKAAMQQLLQVLFSMLKYADRRKAPSIDWAGGGIAQVASAVTGGNLTELASACEGTPIQAEAEAIELQSRGKTQIKHAMEELQGQMRTIVASEYGRWLKQNPDGRNIDLFEMTKGHGNVILFSLNSDAEPDFARYVGSMILSDLTGVSAKRRNGKLTNQVSVYVDEFQAVPPTSVTSLLEKSRESRVAMTLAQQSFEQIIAASERNGEAYLLSILDTCSNFIVHNGATEDSAERLSKILGKHWVTTYRQSNQNQSSFLSTNWSNKRNQMIQTSEEERWVFEPRQFMALSSPDKNNGYRSTAVMVSKTSSDPIFKDKIGGATARTIWMIPNKKVIDEYYTPTFDGEEDDGWKDPSGHEVISSIVVPEAGTEKPAYREPKPAKAITPAGYPEIDPNEPEPVYQEEEDADGGYEWETLEEEDDSELREASSLPELPSISAGLPEPSPQSFNRPQESRRVETALPPTRAGGKRSTMESSSFGSLFNSDYKPEALPDLSEPAKSSEKVEKPAKKVQAPKPVEDFDPDSFELPPLKFD